MTRRKRSTALPMFVVVQEHSSPEALFEWVPRRVGQVRLIIPVGPGGVRVPGVPLPGHTASQGPTRIRALTKL